MTEIAKKIQELYPTFKELEWKKTVFEKEIKRRFEESGEESWNINGLMVQKKTRSDYQYDPAIYDYLGFDERALLPWAVKIPSHLEKTYDLTSFWIRGEDTVSLNALKGKQVKVDKDKKIGAFQEEAENADLQRLINLLKVTKMKFKREEQKYNTLKKELTAELLQSEQGELVVENVGTFRLSEKGGEYDTTQIFSKLQHRYFAFAYRVQGTDADVINLFNGDTFRVNTSFEYDGCIFTVENGELLADGNIFESGLHEAINLKKKEEKAYLESEFVFGYVKVKADPAEFFRQCEISSTKLEKMMDDGLLTPKEIEKYKHKVKETDFPEIIEEVKDTERRKHFYDHLMNRAQVGS